MSHTAKIRGYVLTNSDKGEPRIKLTREKINDFVTSFINDNIITLKVCRYPEYWATEFENLNGKYVELEIKLLQWFYLGRSGWKATFINLHLTDRDAPNDGI
jgi:hypothetical protein